MANFLSTLHASLWTGLEAWTPFTNVVPAGNRVKFYATDPTTEETDTTADPFKSEVRIAQTAAPFRVADSNGYFLDVQVAIQCSAGKATKNIAGGELQLSNLLEVQWAVMAAMVNYEATIKALTWNGYTPCLSVDPMQSKDAFDDEKLGRGMKAWRTVWACQIRCYFTKADIIYTGA